MRKKKKKTNTSSLFFQLRIYCVFLRVFLYFRVTYHVRRFIVTPGSCYVCDQFTWWTMSHIKWISNRAAVMSAIPLWLILYTVFVPLDVLFMFAPFDVMHMKFNQHSIFQSLDKYPCEVYDFLYYICHSALYACELFGTTFTACVLDIKQIEKYRLFCCVITMSGNFKFKVKHDKK